LQDLERYARHLAGDAKGIQLAAQALPARPAWESVAREELDKAEQALRLAIAVVQGARDVYDRLPVIVETWNEAAE
jgi:hypothetical protein